MVTVTVLHDALVHVAPPVGDAMDHAIASLSGPGNRDVPGMGST